MPETVRGQLDAPTSPVPRRTKRPSWLDLRLIIGVILVLLSVLAGALVVTAADHRDPVWAVTHDVGAGTVLQPADVSQVQVRLGSSRERYLPTSQAVIGQAVKQSLRSGELLAKSHLGPAENGVTVTIPIDAQNAPKIASGNRITVWLTTKTCRGVVVLSGITVQEVRSTGSGALSSNAIVNVLVRLSADDAKRVVTALSITDSVIRAGVLSPDQQAALPGSDLDSCVGPAR
ncbi:MAG TPA: SAF domain-containing protein [Jatrophihabitans sp.]|jgi:hypothetical protein